MRRGTIRRSAVTAVPSGSSSGARRKQHEPLDIFQSDASSSEDNERRVSLPSAPTSEAARDAAYALLPRDLQLGLEALQQDIATAAQIATETQHHQRLTYGPLAWATRQTEAAQRGQDQAGRTRTRSGSSSQVTKQQNSAPPPTAPTLQGVQVTHQHAAQHNTSTTSIQHNEGMNLSRDSDALVRMAMASISTQLKVAEERNRALESPLAVAVEERDTARRELLERQHITTGLERELASLKQQFNTCEEQWNNQFETLRASVDAEIARAFASTTKRDAPRFSTAAVAATKAATDAAASGLAQSAANSRDVTMDEFHVKDAPLPTHPSDDAAYWRAQFNTAMRRLGRLEGELNVANRRLGGTGSSRSPSTTTVRRSSSSGSRPPRVAPAQRDQPSCSDIEVGM